MLTAVFQSSAATSPPRRWATSTSRSAATLAHLAAAGEKAAGFVRSSACRPFASFPDLGSPGPTRDDALKAVLPCDAAESVARQGELGCVVGHHAEAIVAGAKTPKARWSATSLLADFDSISDWRVARLLGSRDILRRLMHQHSKSSRRTQLGHFRSNTTFPPTTVSSTFVSAILPSPSGRGCRATAPRSRRACRPGSSRGPSPGSAA